MLDEVEQDSEEVAAFLINFEKEKSMAAQARMPVSEEHHDADVSD